MSEVHKKILKYNQDYESMEIPFIIYAVTNRIYTLTKYTQTITIQRNHLHQKYSLLFNIHYLHMQIRG